MGFGITELITITIILAILILPIKFAASYVGAKNTGVFMCLLALIFAAIIQKGVTISFPLISIQHPIFDSIGALFLSAFAYMLVLGTTYLKGIAIALIQILFTVLLVFIIGLLGLGVTGLFNTI